MHLIDDRKTEDRFQASLLVARRARDLVNGALPFTKKTETNVVSQAIKEYDMGLLHEKEK